MHKLEFEPIKGPPLHANCRCTCCLVLIEDGPPSTYAAPMNEIGEWVTGNYQFLVGTVLGVVGAYAIFQRKSNTLDYSIQSNSALINRGAAAKDREVLVTVDGVRLADPHFLLIRVRNTGKHPIKKADFDQEVMVRTGHKDVFDVSVVDQSEPGVIDAKEDCMIEIHAADDMPITASALPSLMNAGDWFDLSVLCDGEPESVEVTARWAGRDRPMRDAIAASQSRWRRGVVIFCATALVLSLVLYLAGKDEVALALFGLGIYVPALTLFTKLFGFLIEGASRLFAAIWKTMKPAH